MDQNALISSFLFLSLKPLIIILIKFIKEFFRYTINLLKEMIKFVRNPFLHKLLELILILLM